MITLLAAVGLAEACARTRNNETLINETPTFVRQVKNGRLSKVGSGSNYIYIAQLKGSYSEMGEAYGALFKNQLKEQIAAFYGYLQSELEGAVHLPASISKALGTVAKGLLKSVLSLNVAITRKYTPRKFMEEASGIEKGSGVGARQILELNIFPELIKAACTVLGLWSRATVDGQTLHMRALDWDKNFPINKYPLITVYQGTAPGSFRFANVGYLGLIGVLTGISEHVSIGEKVWINPAGSVATTRYGQPWPYVLRDVLELSDGLNKANQIMLEAKRTCTLHLGVASREDKSFRMYQYAEKSLQIFDDRNYTYTKAHPLLEGVAYFDKHVQPSGDQCIGGLLRGDYGHWAAEELWRVVGLSHQTGDTQLAVFELQSLRGWISYSEHGTGVQAYRRSPILVQFRELFKNF